MEFQAVLLAAGKGSRMTDLVHGVPKPLLPVGNKPMMWYSIKLMEKAGIEDIILVALESTLKDIHKMLVENFPKMNFDLEGIEDDKDLGTADSLRRIADKIKTDAIVMSSDLVTDIDLQRVADVYRTYDASLTSFLAKVPEATESVPGLKTKTKPRHREFIGLDKTGQRIVYQSAEADLDENITLRKSVLKRFPHINLRTTLMDAHLYIIKKWVFDLLKDNSSISSIRGDLVPFLVKKQFSHGKSKKTIEHDDEQLQSIDDRSFVGEQKPTDISRYMVTDDLMDRAKIESIFSDDPPGSSGVRCHCFVIDENDDTICYRANTVSSYFEVNRQIHKHLPALTDTQDTFIPASVAVKGKRQIGPDCMIGEGATVGDMVTMKRSSIGRHCTIGDKVKIANSTIMDHVTIKDGCVVQGSIICDNAHINECCELKDCIVSSSQSIPEKSKYTNEVVHAEKMMQF